MDQVRECESIAGVQIRLEDTCTDARIADPNDQIRLGIGPEKPGVVPDYLPESKVFADLVARGTHEALQHPGPVDLLKELGKDLTASEFLRAQTDEQVLAFLQTGRRASDPLNTTGVDMPPRGGNPAFTDDDLKNIITYLRTIQQP